MIFFIILGAAFYNGFLALTQAPQKLSNYVVSQGFSPWTILTIVLIFYLIFGCLMDRDTRIVETNKAVMFFVGSDIVRVVILVLFPAIALFLLPG